MVKFSKIKSAEIIFWVDSRKFNPLKVYGYTVILMGWYLYLTVSTFFRKEISVALKTPNLSNGFKKELKELESSLLKKGNELGLNMKDMKPSNRTIVSVCFNGIGMSVPVDPQLDVGYRPLTMTNSKYI